MRHAPFLPALTLLACATISAGQEPASSSWAGVWEGKLDGQPGVTLTLGLDTGELGGTLVFNVVAKAPGEAEARIIGHDAHVLTHLETAPDALRFQVIRMGDARPLHLTLQRTGPQKAELTCADCGGPSSTELTWIK